MASCYRRIELYSFGVSTMIERKPYPFFMSVEFLTVLVKVGTVSTPFLIAIATTGFSLANLLALLFSGILTGCLLAAKEMQIHQNLYTNELLPLGRNKTEAVRNIQVNQAKLLANNTSDTVQDVLDNIPVQELVDFAVKPGLAKSGVKLFSKLLGRIF
jgi:hypothetical protein